MTASTAAERPCPQCQEPVPVLPGYPDWCDRCGWNVKPAATLDIAAGRFTDLARSLGRRSGARLARQLLAARDLQARWRPGRIAAYAIALAVHLMTLALIAGGVAAIVAGFPDVLALLLGATMLGLGLLMRPRVDKLDPEDGHALEPTSAPTLRGLVADVAQALDRHPPDEIRISAEWNASWRVVDVRRRRVLVLGLPLLVALEPGERVALIAHEVGHERNGDPRRGLIVGSAVMGLDRLSDVLQPPRSGEGALAEAGFGPVEAIAGGFMWLLSRPVDAVLWLLARLLLHDMQRAEYLADALAARVAGTRAAVALQERLLLHSTFELAVQQAAHGDGANVLEHVHAAVQRVPDRERERRRRAARLEEARLEDTHPPTGMRIALLEGRPAQEPRVVLDQTRSQRINAELEPLAERIEHELLDQYRSALYYG